MSTIRTRLAGTAMALAATGALLCTGTASAAAPTADTVRAAAAAQCGAGEICFWQNRNYNGTPWRWTPGSGYRDMPGYLHDNVGSFYANAGGCFIDWDPRERRKVNSGDYAQAYDNSFGSRIDAVDVRC